MNLFLDIDGVIVGKRHRKDIEPSIANHADEFIKFCLKNFTCYWLTTHCRGDVNNTLMYLRRFIRGDSMVLYKKIKPTNFNVFKTEALFGDYYWIDDQPTAYELHFLERNGTLDRWLQVDTRKQPNALLELQMFLAEIISGSL